MTRDEIYEHLAQVYLGKKKDNGESVVKRSGKKLFFQISIMVVVLSCVFYGFTAMLGNKGNNAHASRVIFSLSNNPIRIRYNLNEPFPPVKSFSIPIPNKDIGQYSRLNFTVRGADNGYPGIIKIVVRNSKNETSTYYVKNVKWDWQKISISTDEFDQITDWTNLTDLSFILESWNIDKKEGMVLIDELSFSS